MKAERRLNILEEAMESLTARFFPLEATLKVGGGTRKTVGDEGKSPQNVMAGLEEIYGRLEELERMKSCDQSASVNFDSFVLKARLQALSCQLDRDFCTNEQQPDRRIIWHSGGRLP